MTKNISPVGFGNQGFDVAIYIANRPPIDDYPKLMKLRPMAKGEVGYICARTSNHWRKVFNVYAKFIFELRGSASQYASWQEYRDGALLQAHCREALLFSAPKLHKNMGDLRLPANQSSKLIPTVHIIAGKTYAQALNLGFALHWQDKYFAVNETHRVIVSPYLDYRQLSNVRITQLVAYVKAFAQGATLL